LSNQGSGLADQQMMPDKMVSSNSSKHRYSFFWNVTQCHIPDDRNSNLRLRENLKTRLHI